MAFGPFTATFTREAIAHAERGDWIGAAAYGATVPCVMFLLAMAAAAPWMALS